MVIGDDQSVQGHVALSGTDDHRAHEQWTDATGLPAERLAVVSRLFVEPGQRRRGLGAQLLTHAEDEAVRRGLHAVLDVATHHPAAASLYRGRGWRSVGTAALPPGERGVGLEVSLYIAPQRLDR